MRKGLIIFAWISIVGSLGDGLIAAYATYLSLTIPVVELNISVDLLIRDHLAFLYWVKQIAYYVLPSSVVVWIFSLTAMVYFPVRVISSIAIGVWVLRIASKLPEHKTYKYSS